MKTLAVIQARMGSTRLPGKVLKELCGKPVLQHVIERVSAASIDDIIVATSIDVSNLPLVSLCADLGVQIFIGSEDDVLDRFYQAAKLFKADHIIRITADCPLIDPAIINLVVAEHLKSGADYTSNIIVETFPDGEDVEVFTFKSLFDAWKSARLISEREHVTPFIRKAENGFVHHSVIGKENYGAMRWTLDIEEDYRFIQTIFNKLYSEDPLFSMDKIIEYLKKNPEIEKINANSKRNEGYISSLQNDREVSFNE